MNETTAALALLLVVLVVAAAATRGVAVAVSLLAFAGFNFFFLPPIGSFAIASADDLVALVALLAVSVIGSHLSHLARRRAEESLVLQRQRDEAEIGRRSAEAKSTLVASLSHDVKTPLTAITIAVGNLEATGLSLEQRHEQMQIVRAELDRLTRLFAHVIDMASVEAAAMKPEAEWVAPADIVEAARQQVAQRLASRPVIVTGETDGYLVHVDPRLTSSALAHVLENAAVYSPADAAVSVDVAIEDEHLRIAVRDRGPGLAASEVDRVFDRFYRGSAGGSAFSSGMGLAITRGLLALQGGTVAAANAPGGGAVFTLLLPAAARPLAGAADVV